MFFKPRIFISSLMKNKLELRTKIEKTLTEAGAECMLYEKNLTPSSDNNTYRNDIVDSDFIILILDDTYGAKTNLGISGTEEEYEIAIEHKKKMHIYLQKIDDKSILQEQRDFISKIQASGASYYYYKDETDLLKRIKSSLFAIANTISLNNLSFDKLNYNVVVRQTFALDYKNATDIISIHNEMLSLINLNGLGYLNTTIFLDFTEPVINSIAYGNVQFLDYKILELLQIAHQCARNFNAKHSIIFTTNGTYINYTSPVLGQLMIGNCYINNPYENDTSELETLFKDYLNKFSIFIDYIEKKKLQIDCIRD